MVFIATMYLGFTYAFSGILLFRSPHVVTSISDPPALSAAGRPVLLYVRDVLLLTKLSKKR